MGLVVGNLSCLAFGVAWMLGKTQTPRSSALSFWKLGFVCPGNMWNLLSKSSGLKWFEQRVEDFEGSNTRLALTKSTQIFRRFLASGRPSPKYGIVWRLIPTLRLALFVQLAATQLKTIFLRAFKFNLLRTANTRNVNTIANAQVPCVTSQNILVPISF